MRFAVAASRTAPNRTVEMQPNRAVTMERYKLGHSPGLRYMLLDRLCNRLIVSQCPGIWIGQQYYIKELIAQDNTCRISAWPGKLWNLESGLESVQAFYEKNKQIAHLIH